jgi:putative redox protein
VSRVFYAFAEREEDSMGAQVIVRSVTGERFTQEVEAGGHRLLADEPQSVGGADRGPSPYEWVLGALGT